ncbi:putative GPI-anchored cupredoxin [Psilocybe cubensis]|uniref:GPI-anchored cupredoxin n=2 Tax=Psilocybe cubensis TaxID=181762 RepID=A0ACB8GP99_PSICU|nr:putative GPI-anchored cupredoxin [Psilocybe cubensis]KAH9477300.1 putative GPI-anchored cupredoxin [Psilocybe cubensis]
MLSLPTLISLALVSVGHLSSFVQGASFAVQVGANGALEYSPSSITATDGDEVVFTFNPKNHTVTQTSFASPCAPLEGGFDTGFVPISSGTTTKTFTIPTGTGNSPLWFSCSQSTHCQQGMVFAINPPAAPASGVDHTFPAFKANAQGLAGINTSPNAGTGVPSPTPGTLGSHDPSTASGSVFSAASVNDGATGSATIADVPTTTQPLPTGAAGAATFSASDSGSGSAGANPTSSAKNSAAKGRGGAVKESAMLVGAVFFIFVGFL